MMDNNINFLNLDQQQYQQQSINNNNNDIMTMITTIDFDCDNNNNDDNDNGIEDGDYDDGDDDDNEKEDPFSPKCRIPLPNLYGGGGNDNHIYFDSSTFIKRRNERERTRVRNVNEGFERLRNHLPLLPNQREKRLSKVETLRLAISYIKHLQNLLES